MKEDRTDQNTHALAQALPAAMLSELRAPLGPQNYLPAEEPAALGAAYAAPTGYNHQQRDDRLDSKRLGALSELLAMVAQLLPPSAQKILGNAKNGIESAKNTSEINAQLAQAVKEIANALSDDNQTKAQTAESPEEKKARLWSEIHKLNEETLKGMDALHDAKLMGDEERDKWKIELNEIMKMQDGDEKMARLASFTQQYGSRLQEIRDSLPSDDPRRGLVEKEITIIAQTKKNQEDLSQALQAETSGPSATLQSMGGANSLVSAVQPIEVTSASVTKAVVPPPALISASESVSGADSGQLSPTNIKVVAAPTKAVGTQL